MSMMMGSISSSFDPSKGFVERFKRPPSSSLTIGAHAAAAATMTTTQSRRKVRNFVANSVETPRLLQRGDRVLVHIPEDMLVVHPHLSHCDCKLGTILSEVNQGFQFLDAHEEVQVRMKHTNEIETVPAFFLCLEDEILAERTRLFAASAESTAAARITNPLSPRLSNNLSSPAQAGN